MYQFINGIAFELALFILFFLGYLSMKGKISLGIQGADFESWREKNGRIVAGICLLTLFMLLASIISKYLQFFGSNPVTPINP